MSNLAYQVQEQNKRLEKRKVKKQPQRKFRVTAGERFLYVIFVSVMAIAGLFTISNQASIYQLNNEIQSVDQQLVNQYKLNSGLEEEISALSNPKRILQIAEQQGLVINDKNIHVIHR